MDAQRIDEQIVEILEDSDNEILNVVKIKTILKPLSKKELKEFIIRIYTGHRINGYLI